MGILSMRIYPLLPSPHPEHEVRKEAVRAEEPGEQIVRARDPGAETARVRDVVAAVRRGFTEPLFKDEARNINVLDNSIQDDKMRLQRYWFPSLGLGDYMRAVRGGLYNGRSVGLLCYEPAVGCYAMLSLGLSREESEDRYEELVREFQCERHALHTQQSGDWWVCRQRKNNPIEYAEAKRILRECRLTAMQEAVDEWKAKGLLADVIIPTYDFLINQMHFLPEYVACNDTIIFVYKRLPPEERIPGVMPIAEHVYRLSHEQRKARVYYDRLDRSFAQRVREDYLVSAPLIGGLFQPAPSQHSLQNSPSPAPLGESAEGLSFWVCFLWKSLWKSLSNFMQAIMIVCKAAFRAGSGKKNE